MKLKAMINQENINSTDIHGRTPLMYAVIGKKSKVSYNIAPVCCVFLYRGSTSCNIPVAITII